MFPLAALALIVFAFFFAHPQPTGGPRFRDFEAYYAAGVTWREEGDPYARDIWRVERTIPGVLATRDELLPFVGPPFGLPLWNLLASLFWKRATELWAVMLVLSFGSLALGTLALARVPLTPARALAALAFAAVFGPLSSGVALGQAAVPACAAVVLCALALRLRRSAVPAFFAALVAALQPNIAVALLPRMSGARSAVAIAGAAGVAFFGSALALSQNGGLDHYTRALADHAAAERFSAIQTAPSAVLRALGAPATSASGLGLVLAAVVLSTLGWQWASRRYGADDRLILASAALPLAWPFAHEHDFTLAFIPALAVVARTRGTPWVVAACAAVAVATDWLGRAQRPSDLGFATLGTSAAALALVGLASQRLRPFHAVPLAMTLVTAGAAALTTGHPLPIWPDALPLDYHAPHHATVASLWHDEQVRAGIARLDPRWGLLRALSLAGCATLWFVGSHAFYERRERPATSP